jgi:spoIIIJ-associated protein
MNKYLFTGKSVDDAIRKGLNELGLSKSQVIVSVLELPSRGILGFIGAKDAKVSLEIRNVEVEQALDIVAESKRYLAMILDDMGMDANIQQSTSDDSVIFQVSGKDVGALIGRRGQTLDAVQLVMNVFVNRLSDEHVRIVVDAEGFRERRRKTLEDLSLRLANQVIRTKREVVLEPMTAHERRIIHYQLQHHPKVKTMSKGEEPNRRIVIMLKS